VHTAASPLDAGVNALKQSMRRILSVFAVTLVVSATFVVSADPAEAWDGRFRKDPDTLVDPARLRSVVSQLLAPASTIGDGDTAPVGVGTEAVGVDLAAEAASETLSASSSGTVYWVDNTPLSGDCPPTSYPTIQAAINASGPNDTVKVCPGTYPEQVRIVGHNHDGLKLESLKPLQAVIQWPPAEVTPLALVYFNQADGVTLRGFKITGPFTFNGCSPERHEGILVDNAFDERIHHNHITLIRNSNPAMYGCQEGDAVAIGRRVDVPPASATPGSAKVDHNVIDDYQKNGVQVTNAGSSAKVDHNVIRGADAGQIIIASNGVVVIRGASATIDHNVISNNNYTPFPLSSGVIVAEAPPGSSSVNHNRIFDNDYGVNVDTQNNLEISHNDLFDNRADAIAICGDATFSCGFATGIVVRSNDIHDNRGSGIALYGADANLLKSNHVESNGGALPFETDGIQVDSASAGNRILTNHMAENVVHDCHDDSVGTGTALTANEWEGNRGLTQNRPGLCRP
jgi:parallel beta-helix repeat protein